MVFWATVLAFIVGIMYYMVYPYDTKIKEVYLPASETYIAGFVAQHQAAKDFSKEAAVAINNLTVSAPNAANGSDKSVLVLSHSDPDKSMINAFLMPTASSSETEALRPAALGSSSSSNTGFVSVLACFDMPERKFQKNEDYVQSKLVDCRSATTKYVMTYGPLPDEGDSPYMKNKTLLWEAALLKRTKGNPDCGFLFYDGDSKRFFVNNSKHLTRNVPVAFTDLLGTTYIEKTHGRAVVNGFADSGEVLFCMSPVNDPYPRLGLKVNLDGEVNALPVGEHAETLPANGWLNLVDEDAASVARIQNVGGNADWFVSACQGEMCAENKMAFSFNKERTVQVVPMKNFSSNGDLFGMPFTISMMASFKQGSYPVFATRDAEGGSACTPSYDKPCVHADYYNGVLTITVSRLDMPNSVLTALVPEAYLTQVDYLFNADSHRLYVNGQMVAHATFPSKNELDYQAAHLAGNAFILGGEHADYNLYNFLVYNRSPSTETVGNDKFDLYGLPRVFKTNTERYIKPR